MSIFVVDIGVGFGALVKFEVGAEFLIVGYRGVEGFAGRKGGFEGGAFGGSFCVAEGKGPAVEVVTALAGLFSLKVVSVLFLFRKTSTLLTIISKDLAGDAHSIVNMYDGGCVRKKTLALRSPTKIWAEIVLARQKFRGPPTPSHLHCPTTPLP